MHTILQCGSKIVDNPRHHRSLSSPQMYASTFRTLRAYTRYSRASSLRFLCANTILQANREHALSLPYSKLAADMCYHIAPACGRHASPPSPKLAATLRRKYLLSALLSEANLRQHRLSSSRPTCASLPCNILLRRMPCTRPAQATPPFSPRLPGDNHPTPPAPSAKPPILRFYDLRHCLQRRAQHWPLASSIFPA